VSKISDFRESYLMDSRADDLPDYVGNLNRIERDLFGLPPTEIDLPRARTRVRAKQRSRPNQLT
jgi:hypothetical protein